MPPPWNYQMRTNPFVFSVLRFAERHARWSCPSICLSQSLRRARRPRRAACRNYRLRTNPFVFAVCHLRGTDGACPIPTNIYRESSVGRGHAPAAEPPNPYKPVCLYCPPLTRSARRGRRALRAVLRSPSVARGIPDAPWNLFALANTSVKHP